MNSQFIEGERTWDMKYAHMFWVAVGSYFCFANFDLCICPPTYTRLFVEVQFYFLPATIYGIFVIVRGKHWPGFRILLCGYRKDPSYKFFPQRLKRQAVILPSDSATWCVMKGLLKWPCPNQEKLLNDFVSLALPVRFKVLSNNHLQIRGIKKSDEGAYTCEGRIMARGEIDLRIIKVIVNGEESIRMHGNQVWKPRFTA